MYLRRVQEAYIRLPLHLRYLSRLSYPVNFATGMYRFPYLLKQLSVVLKLPVPYYNILIAQFLLNQV
jgi:hypothetical protein